MPASKRERVSVCVCEREIESERECGWVRGRERKIERERVLAQFTNASYFACRRGQARHRS